MIALIFNSVSVWGYLKYIKFFYWNLLFLSYICHFICFDTFQICLWRQTKALKFTEMLV